MTLLHRIAALLLALAAAGCATTGETTNKDPWEGFNRGTYAFNDAVDRAVLKPLATGYVKITPGPVREGVNNFFDNLEDIMTGFNNILQGKVKDGAGDWGRFVVNTVFGVAGLWDIATPLGLEKHYEDFGQTLAVWGVNSGPYLILPLLGPSNMRDAPARLADISWYYSKYVDPEGLYWTLWGLDKVRTRANLFRAEGVLDEAALDKYSFLRDAWVQRRRSMVYDGNPPRVKEEE